MVENTSEEVYYKKCSAYLEVANDYRLGGLTTEKSNPLTENLSLIANKNLQEAISILKQADISALEKLHRISGGIDKLRISVKKTLNDGNKIFLCGCGATGRLSLALEFIWRQLNCGSELEQSVIGFMAGGDVALINSLEQFEDYPKYGARHLNELGFGKGDLFIGITEGGETPYVIGATEESQKLSIRKPFFLYCNPNEILHSSAGRSRNIINNPDINKLNLEVGEMAITGSTRMQASTVLMYAVGLCLLHYGDNINIEYKIRSFIDHFARLNLKFLDSFIEREVEIYKKGEFIYYETNKDYGISILTDTTERSPTFSLIPFENQNSEIIEPSLCYLLFPGSENSSEAWHSLLSREPRVLNWKEISDHTTKEWLLGFDFSKNLINLRENYLLQESKSIVITESDNILKFELNELQCSANLKGLSILEKHLCLKMILNTLSSLVMARMGRIDGNIMTWVRPSNNKLIDRTIRYVDLLLQKKGYFFSYENIAKACFKLMPQVKPDEPIVLAVVKFLMKSKTN